MKYQSIWIYHSDPSKGYKGISAFIVEKEWGVEIAKKEKKVRFHMMTYAKS